MYRITNFKTLGLCAFLIVACDSKTDSDVTQPEDEATVEASLEKLEEVSEATAEVSLEVEDEDHDDVERPETFYCGKVLCSADQICLLTEVVDDDLDGANVGCADVPDVCDGVPTCECVGDICLEDCTEDGDGVSCYGEWPAVKFESESDASDAPVDSAENNEDVNESTELLEPDSSTTGGTTGSGSDTVGPVADPNGGKP